MEYTPAKTISDVSDNYIGRKFNYLGGSPGKHQYRD